MGTQALVLLSGGLDSVYNLYESHQRWPGGVQAITFNYGQKAWLNEKKAAEYFADSLKVPLQVLEIAKIFVNDRSSLTSVQKEISTSQVNIESREASVESAKNVWVANRNGVFLNIAACIAEIIGASYIIPGFNAEEAETFPDNSEEYILKMNQCLKMSTSNAVQIHCFSQKMNKSEIVIKAQALGVDLDQIWSCYYQGNQPCGQCESCQRFLRAKRSIQK